MRVTIEQLLKRREILIYESKIVEDQLDRMPFVQNGEVLKLRMLTRELSKVNKMIHRRGIKQSWEEYKCDFGKISIGGNNAVK